MKRLGNILRYGGSPEKEERVEAIVSGNSFLLERIISWGQATEEGVWLEGERDEWVALVKGRAAVRFEAQDELAVLEEGDTLYIPAHERHRVEWTDDAGPSIWIALHAVKGII